MGTSSRRSRRRRRPSAQTDAAEANRSPLPLKSSEAAAAVALASFVLLFVAIVLLASGGTGGGKASDDAGTVADDSGAITPDTDAATSDAGAASDTDAATDDEQPTAGDEEAIQTLARRSIEVLPAGQWPSLYDSYTSEFQQRCPRAEFDQAGVEAAAQLGDGLRLLTFLLEFQRLVSVTIEDSSAQAVITGEIFGQGEYQLQAVFQKEAGDWKIAPAPDTQGCEAFGRLDG